EVARTSPGPDGRRPALEDDEIARRLALAAAEVEAMRAMTYRSLSLGARTGMPGAEASMIRLFFSELIQRIDALAMEILGPAALGGFRADGAPTGEWVERYLTGLSQTIGGGTKEIQRNIIGERVLGLPRWSRARPRHGPCPRPPAGRRPPPPSRGAGGSPAHRARPASDDRGSSGRRGAVARGRRARLVRAGTSRDCRRGGLRSPGGHAALPGAGSGRDSGSVARHRPRRPRPRRAPRRPSGTRRSP